MKRNHLLFRRATHVAQQKQKVLDEKMQSFFGYIISWLVGCFGA